MRVTGTLRKWTDKGWGIANSYELGPNTPTRFFVHIKNARDEAQEALALGVRITFDVGEPRNPGELPTALNIEIAPPISRQPVLQVGQETLAKAPTNPITSKPTNGEEGGR